MLPTVAVTTVALLAGTACAPSPGQEAALLSDLDRWISETIPAPAEGGFSISGNTSPDGGRSTGTTSDVEPGWYAITTACALAGPGAGLGNNSARLTLSGAHGTYGERDCPVSPMTTTTYLGASGDAPPETVVVRVEAATEELFWGVSASPTTAPE